MTTIPQDFMASLDERQRREMWEIVKDELNVKEVHIVVDGQLKETY